MKLSNNVDVFLGQMQADLAEEYHEFCDYQKIVQKTLAAFHDVCVKHGITYYLAYGSLLGAIRDNGQIPWDYDIDVWVPYKQAQRVMDALDQDLSEEYHYITRFKDPNYRTYTLKLAPKEYDCEVLHVDVFWLTGAYDDPKENEKMHQLKTKHHNVSLIKYCPKKYLGVSGRVSEAIYTLRKLKCSVYSGQYLDRMFQRFMSKACEGSTLWTDNAEIKEYRSEWFGEPQIIRIASGQELYVPQYYEEILKMQYGDYMKTPPVKGAREEFEKSLHRLRSLAKI